MIKYNPKDICCTPPPSEYTASKWPNTLWCPVFVCLFFSSSFNRVSILSYITILGTINTHSHTIKNTRIQCLYLYFSTILHTSCSLPTVSHYTYRLSVWQQVQSSAFQSICLLLSTKHIYQVHCSSSTLSGSGEGR